MHEDYELRIWSKKFGVSLDELKKAVQSVGTSAEAGESTSGSRSKRMPRTSAVKKRSRRTADGKDHTAARPSDLSESEQDLYSHLQGGDELETDSLGGEPLLRRRKDQETFRPLSATRNTVKALEERGLIMQTKRGDPLRIVWALNGSKSRKTSRTKLATKSRRAATRRK